MRVPETVFKVMVMAGFIDRIALVTGAGSAEGIGFATARAFAMAGARVAITSTTRRIFERLETLGDAHAAFAADLTMVDDVNALINAVKQKYGCIDIVVNNAGMVQQGVDFKSSRIENITDSEWHRHLALNATTAFNVTRAVLPLMQKQEYGRIVNVSSVTGPLVTNPKAAGYSSAKAAMTGLTRVTAIENASRNITCNAVLPGWIETASSSPEEILAGKATPSKRPGRPDEIAAACLFLASEEASYVNGAMLVVDGANSIVEFKGAGDAWY
jgi:3-oxoacyl-[acyl-carrier protein] reductase